MRAATLPPPDRAANAVHEGKHTVTGWARAFAAGLSAGDKDTIKKMSLMPLAAAAA